MKLWKHIMQMVFKEIKKEGIKTGLIKLEAQK
jgi:hypothetical protein